MNGTTSQRGQSPIKEFRAGTIRAAVWENELTVGKRTVVQHSVRIEKRFYDEATQEWRNTNYFFANDLPRLRLVAEQAFEFIVLRDDSKDVADAV